MRRGLRNWGSHPKRHFAASTNQRQRAAGGSREGGGSDAGRANQRKRKGPMKRTRPVRKARERHVFVRYSGKLRSAKHWRDVPAIFDKLKEVVGTPDALSYAAATERLARDGRWREAEILCRELLASTDGRGDEAGGVLRACTSLAHGCANFARSALGGLSRRVEEGPSSAQRAKKQRRLQKRRAERERELELATSALRAARDRTSFESSAREFLRERAPVFAALDTLDEMRRLKEGKAGSDADAFPGPDGRAFCAAAFASGFAASDDIGAGFGGRLALAGSAAGGAGVPLPDYTLGGVLWRMRLQRKEEKEEGGGGGGVGEGEGAEGYSLVFAAGMDAAARIATHRWVYTRRHAAVEAAAADAAEEAVVGTASSNHGVQGNAAVDMVPEELRGIFAPRLGLIADLRRHGVRRGGKKATKPSREGDDDLLQSTLFLLGEATGTDVGSLTSSTHLGNGNEDDDDDDDDSHDDDDDTKNARLRHPLRTEIERQARGHSDEAWYPWRDDAGPGPVACAALRAVTAELWMRGCDVRAEALRRMVNSGNERKEGTEEDKKEEEEEEEEEEEGKEEEERGREKGVDEGDGLLGPACGRSTNVPKLVRAIVATTTAEDGRDHAHVHEGEEEDVDGSFVRSPQLRPLPSPDVAAAAARCCAIGARAEAEVLSAEAIAGAETDAGARLVAVQSCAAAASKYAAEAMAAADALSDALARSFWTKTAGEAEDVARAGAAAAAEEALSAAASELAVVAILAEQRGEDGTDFGGFFDQEGADPVATLDDCFSRLMTTHREFFMTAEAWRANNARGGWSRGQSQSQSPGHGIDDELDAVLASPSFFADGSRPALFEGSAAAEAAEERARTVVGLGGRAGAAEVRLYHIALDACAAVARANEALALLDEMAAVAAEDEAAAREARAELGPRGDKRGKGVKGRRRARDDSPEPVSPMRPGVKAVAAAASALCNAGRAAECGQLLDRAEAEGWIRIVRSGERQVPYENANVNKINGNNAILSISKPREGSRQHQRRRGAASAQIDVRAFRSPAAAVAAVAWATGRLAPMAVGAVEGEGGLEGEGEEERSDDVSRVASLLILYGAGYPTASTAAAAAPCPAFTGSDAIVELPPIVGSGFGAPATPLVRGLNRCRVPFRDTPNGGSEERGGDSSGRREFGGEAGALTILGGPRGVARMCLRFPQHVAQSGGGGLEGEKEEEERKVGGGGNGRVSGFSGARLVEMQGNALKEEMGSARAKAKHNVGADSADRRRAGSSQRRQRRVPERKWGREMDKLPFPGRR